MAKDYYVILGVARDATPERVRLAYRELAKVLHPDRTGGESGPFLDVQEAYSVLSDTVSRRDYDRRLQDGDVWRRAPVEPVDGPEPEPLVPDPQAPSKLGAISLARSFATYSPSYDEVFDWLWRNFDSLAATKSGTVRDLDVHVPVSRAQARRGGVAQILVPARAACPTCRGRGGVDFYRCWRCAGEGALAGELPLSISFPAGMSGSHAVTIPLARFGIRNTHLTVHFRVEDAT